MVLAALLIVAAGHRAEAKYASIVIDAETGVVLHETNADTRNYPASLTKMMTLYLVFEALQKGDLSLSDQMSVSSRAAKQQPSKLGLKSGQTISVDNAIRALVTKSANDVAVVVAEALGDTEWGFAKLMTAKAKALGMSRTNFYNASGLPDSRQLSTARDMATLSVALMRDFPQYYHYFSLTAFTYKGKTYKNHNKLLDSYNGVDGIKTGYTKASGFNIAVSAVHNGRRLIAVVFGGKTSKIRNNHASDLLDAAFITVEELNLPKGGNLLQAYVEPAAPPEKPLIPVALPVVQPDQGSAEDIVVAEALPPPEMVTEVTPPPLPVETQVAALTTVSSDASPLGVWSIQVGAFSRYANAEKAAAYANVQAPTPLAGASIAVMEVRGDKGLLYRARLANLTEDNAREACRLLTSQNTACLVIAPGG